MFWTLNLQIICKLLVSLAYRVCSWPTLEIGRHKRDPRFFHKYDDTISKSYFLILYIYPTLAIANFPVELSSLHPHTHIHSTQDSPHSIHIHTTPASTRMHGTASPVISTARPPAAPPPSRPFHQPQPHSLAHDTSSVSSTQRTGSLNRLALHMKRGALIMKLSSTEFAKSRSALWRFRKGKMREGNALQIMKQEASTMCEGI